MPKISKVQLIKLQKKYVTDAAIGDALGVTRQAVHQLRSKLGISSAVADRRGRNSAMIAAYNAGAAGTAVAQKFGLSISQTYRVINAAKAKVRRAEKKSAAKVKAKMLTPVKKKKVSKKKKKK